MQEETLEAPTLDALRGLHLPEPVSNAPQTTAWWVLFAVLAVLLVVLAVVAVRRWRRNRYRRDALARLDALGAMGLGDLPHLVKRVALDAWPREQIASLTGAPWLAFLDRSLGGGTAFQEGPGRHLPALAYGGPPQLGEVERRALVALVRTWIRKHRVDA
jgi:hypothetical protein